MENELKSCPCCESTDLKGQSISRNMLDCFQSYVTCNKCGLCQLEFNWNTRPIEDKLRIEIKLLTEEKNALLKVNHKLKLELEKEY